MKFNKTMTAAALAATLTIAGGTAAFAHDNGGGTRGGRGAASVATICADTDAALAKMTARQTKLTTHIATLTTAKATATTAGNTTLATRIQRRIDRETITLNAVTARIAAFPAWVEANCAS